MDNEIKAASLNEKALYRSRGRLGKLHIEVDEKFESMNSLIEWNISKVLETKPDIDLKTEIAAMQEILETRSWDINRVVSHCPEERHLACALLAWQQLGHGDASSLYQFIQSKFNKTGENEGDSLVTRNIYIVSTSDVSCKSKIFIQHSESIYSDSSVFNDFDSGSNFGPVVKLPVEAKVVMRCEHGSKPRQPTIRCEKKTQHGGPEKKNPLPCARMSSCHQRLVEMDSTTAALKKRVDRLGKREGDRMRLIMRAEAAWKDLEQGYINRLSSADDKEDEIIKKIKNCIQERSNYKQSCSELSKRLEERLSDAEKEKEEVKRLEKEVGVRSRKKLLLNEDAAGVEASLIEEHCRLAQYERQLRSKEEQARRKVANSQNEVETVRALRYEVERALRAELGVLKDQVAKVSKRLLTEETDAKRLKNEIAQVRERKSRFIEDLDECKLICDSRMQGKMNELRTKTQKLEAIKDQVLECRCKQPKDNSIEVKRTPSLAAICRCTSEDKLHGSCSCKSVRTTLLSNLLRDLFEGLQSELNDNGAIMPCELLKCLEDSHNWDRTSPVKTNLRNFFGKLLVGELDIAIASSIEKYHARWIGDSCADRKKSELDQRQQRALENRAQQLAEQLAERLFQERADQIMKKAKKVMKDSQQPCECSNTQPAATYSCILNTNIDKPQKNTKIKNKVYPILKENTVKSIQNQMALQKTKMFKKSALKPIKEKTNKPTKPVAVRDKKRMASNHILNHRAVSTDMYEIDSNFLMSRMKKKYVGHDTRFDTLKNSYLSQNVSKNSCLKGFQRDHNYAINLCLFDPHKDQDMGKTSPSDKVETNTTLDGKEIQHRGFDSPRFLEDMPSIELANSVLQPFVLCNENSREGNTLTCSNNCVCFNKLASNHSLDNILESYREREISYYTELKEKENDIFVTNQDSMRSPYYFDIFDKHCDDENKQKLSAFIRETNKRVNIFKSDYNQNLVDGFDTKGVNCEMTQAPIKNKLSCKDEVINTSFNDINDFRRDQNDLFFQSKQNEGTPFPNRCSKYTNIERNLCDTKTSARSFHVLDNTGSLNVIKNSVVDTSRDPYNFDCRVDFLGVTLHSSKNQNIENKNKSTNKPSKQETSEGVVQIYYDDEKGNEHLKVFKNKFDKRNIQTSVTNYYRQNYNTDMHFSNTENKCVCCNKDEEISELEVNTFTLLMEYLQKKLEEYKLSTYKSSNISPFEADLLFNQILEKVKKMILESSKELTCLCFNGNESDGIDACWRRACGLLQEYLRAKIKRLECSCSFDVEDCGSHSLSKVLDKICKMIENDFERLKAISKDTNSLKYNISHSNEKEISNAKFNGSLFNINEDSNVFSKKNSFKDTQFTNLMNDNLSDKNLKNSKDKQIVPNVEAAEKCYSFYSKKSDVINFAENAQDPYSIINEIDNETVVTSVLTKENGDIDINQNRNTQSMSVPCVSNNVDCACNKILGGCTCTNAILLKRNTNLIDANTTPSNIIQHATDFTKPIVVPYNLLQENEKLCEKEVETIVNEEVVELKGSGCEFQKGANHSTNTHNNLYDNIDFFSYDEWDDCESVPYHDNVDDDASNKAKFYNSLLLPIDEPGNSAETEHISKNLLSTSDDLVLCSFRSHDCECEMVPICHVKMLMDNIERKLLNFKCTCDSLHPSVCPAHSNAVS